MKHDDNELITVRTTLGRPTPTSPTPTVILNSFQDLALKAEQAQDTEMNSAWRHRIQNTLTTFEMLLYTLFYTEKDISMKHPHVYIMVNNKNTTLYIGVTSQLPQRVYQHKLKIISGFTSKYNLTKLVYFESFDYMYDAISRESSWRIGGEHGKIT